MAEHGALATLKDLAEKEVEGVEFYSAMQRAI